MTADCRIINSKNLMVSEASLTGEMMPVEKNSELSLPEKTLLPERKNMIFMGTIVEQGLATAIVVATGFKTELGKIVGLLKKTKEEKTLLQKNIIKLSEITGVFILFIISLIVIIGYFNEKSFADIFVAALALAVSAIPAGLLPAITIILVLAMRRIFKQQGLV